MNSRPLILILFLCVYFTAIAQTPAQLPSLFNDGYETPTVEKNESPASIIRKSIFVKAIASKTSAYVGEPVIVTYKLYSCIYCRSRINRQPSFNGCSVTDVSYSSDPEIEDINGKIFHVYTIRKVQIVPLEAGALELGQAAIDNVVPFTNADNTPDNYALTIANDPLTIEVKALPEVNKPENFTGVIGDFTISAAVDSNNIPAGENATLRITIKGSGNFTGIHLPGITWPGETEHFESTDTQHLNDNGYPVTGYKSFSIPFIALKEGMLTIPPVSFNYFDAADNAYKIINSNPVNVSFTKPIDKKQQLQNIVQQDVSNSKYLWIIGAIALAVITVIFISNKSKGSKQQQAAPQAAASIATEKTAPTKDEGIEILSALNRLGTVEDDKKFLAGATQLLTAALQIKFNRLDETSDECIALLRAEDAELANTCTKIYAACNRNLYSPDSKEGVKEEIYYELSAVIKKLYPLS